MNATNVAQSFVHDGSPDLSELIVCIDRPGFSQESLTEASYPATVLTSSVESSRHN
jgi:hypothetical protein